jgi:hypothetical protein
LGADEEVLFDGQTLVCAPDGFETLDEAVTDRYFRLKANDDGIAAVITIIYSSIIGVLYSDGTTSFIESPHRVHFATLYNNKVVVDGPNAVYYLSTFSEVEGTNGLFSSNQYTKKVMGVIDGRIYAAEDGVQGFKYLDDTVTEVVTPAQFWDVNKFLSFNDKIVIANQNDMWEFDPATSTLNLFPGSSEFLVISANVYPSDSDAGGIYVLGLDTDLNTVLHYISPTYEWNDAILVGGGQVATFGDNDYWSGSVPGASGTLWEVELSKESLREVVFNNNLEVYGFVYTEEKLYGLPGAFFGNPFYDYGYEGCYLVLAEEPNSILSDETTEDVQVYPNPATDVLTVEVKNLSGVSIVSLTGQKFDVPTFTGGTTTLNTSGLSNGVYLLRAEKTDGTVGTVLFEKL